MRARFAETKVDTVLKFSDKVCAQSSSFAGGGLQCGQKVLSLIGRCLVVVCRRRQRTVKMVFGLLDHADIRPEKRWLPSLWPRCACNCRSNTRSLKLHDVIAHTILVQPKRSIKPFISCSSKSELSQVEGRREAPHCLDEAPLRMRI